MAWDITKTGEGTHTVRDEDDGMLVATIAFTGNRQSSWYRTSFHTIPALRFECGNLERAIGFVLGVEASLQIFGRIFGALIPRPVSTGLTKRN